MKSYRPSDNVKLSKYSMNSLIHCAKWPTWRNLYDWLIHHRCIAMQLKKPVSISAKLSKSLYILTFISAYWTKIKTGLFDFFFSQHITRLNTHKELYEKLKNVSANGDIVQMDELDKHVVDLFLFDFEQSGIHLDETARQKVVYLNDCILRLGQRFMAGALTPRSVSGKSLPSSVKK